MRKLLTGVLVAAVLVSQTSIADVFVHTDAATVLAADGGFDGVPADELLPGDNGDPKEEGQQVKQPVGNPAEAQLPAEDAGLKKEETPVNPDATLEEDPVDENAKATPSVTTEGDGSDIEGEDTEIISDIMPMSNAVVLLDDGGEEPTESTEPETWTQSGGKIEITLAGNELKIARKRLENSGDDGEPVDMEGFGTSGNVTSADWGKHADVITSIIVEEGVKSIGAYAFYGLTNVTSVEIGKTVKSIGAGAFQGCSSLTEIDLSEITGGAASEGNNNSFSIGADAFHDSGLTEIKLPTGFTGLNIGSNAFRGSNLSSIEFPSDISDLDIGTYAFADCSELKHLEIPTNITNININVSGVDNAFANSSLEWIAYPSSLKDKLEDAIKTTGNAKIVQIVYEVVDEKSVKVTETITPNNWQPDDKVNMPSQILGMNITEFEGDSEIVSEEGHDELHKSLTCENRCIICGATGEHEYVYSEVESTPANCQDGGTKVSICSVCSDMKTESTNPDPLAHVFTNNKWEGNEEGHQQYCERENQPVGEVQDHVVTNWTTDKEATTTEEGSKHGPCDICGYNTTETIPKKTPSTPTPSTPSTGGNSGSGNNGGSSSGSSSSSSGSSASSVSTSTGSNQSTDSTAAIPGTITVITYTVEPGDTLSKIALKYFGAASYWTKIYEDNKDTIADPNKIYVGQVIIINVAQVDTAAAAAGTTATGEGTYYTVESGDSLFKIAKKVYGNGKDWRLIYGANDAITDPGRIYSGQVIFIPVKQ